MEEMLRRNRLRWLGNVHRMEDNRLARQVVKWVPKGGWRKRGRPQKNWRATVEEDLEQMEMSCEEVEIAEIAAGDRMMWKSCVAEGTGRTKVLGKVVVISYKYGYIWQYWNTSADLIVIIILMYLLTLHISTVWRIESEESARNETNQQLKNKCFYYTTTLAASLCCLVIRYNVNIYLSQPYNTKMFEK